jgi:hypothetical protein
LGKNAALMVRLVVAPVQPLRVKVKRASPAVWPTLYEYFATNGSDPLSGLRHITDMPGYYHSQWPDVGLRLIHNQSGQAFSRYWQRRPMQGDYNQQSGRVEFRARHFSDVPLELVKLGANTGSASSVPGEGLYQQARANGYIAFQGAGLRPARAPAAIRPVAAASGNPEWRSA